MDHTLEPGLTRSAAASFLQVGATSRLLVFFSPDETARGRIALLEGRPPAHRAPRPPGGPAGH